MSVAKDKIKLNDVWYFLFVGIFCACIVMYSRYTFNLDDIWNWLNIFNKEPILDGYRPSIGRFNPLYDVDINFFMQFVANPYFYFALNAIEVFIIAFLVRKMIKYSSVSIVGGGNNLLALFAIGVLFLNPGFVTVMVGICYPERLEILFLCGFLVASYRFYESYKLKYAIIGVICANMALYLKEPVFLIIGSFGALHLIISLAKRQKIQKIFWLYHLVLVISACVFIGIYLFHILPQIDSAYDRLDSLSLTQTQRLLLTLKGYGNFVINDSWVMILMAFVGFMRVIELIKAKSFAILHPFWDSALVGAILYVLAFLKLGIFETYYLLPSYFVGFGSVIYIVCSWQIHKKLYLMTKVLIALCACIWLLSALPQAITQFVWLKTTGTTFHDTLEFMSSYVNKQDKRVRIYFDGIGQNRVTYNTWYVEYFIRYLEELYKSTNFDVLNKEIQDDKNIPLNPESRYLFKSLIHQIPPQKGDIIILTNATNKNANISYIDSMKEHYKLIYQTHRFGIPYFGLKPFIKYLMCKQNEQNCLLSNDSTLSQNLFKLPINNYVFLVE